MTTTLSSYLQITANQTKYQTLTQKAPDVAQQTKYFQDNIGKIASGADLVKNPRLFNYALTAFGLGDQTYAKALFTKVLAQGVSSKTALANTLNNPKIRAFAQAFDFAGKGSSLTSATGFAAGVVGKFVEQTLETNQGKQNPGVQLALYFQRNAPNLTSIYGILADKNLLTVVQTALGISPLTSGESVDRQAKLLQGAVKIADFQDSKKLQAFISRFAALYDYNNAGGGTNPANAPNALLYDSSGGGIDINTLLSLQTIRTG